MGNPRRGGRGGRGRDEECEGDEEEGGGDEEDEEEEGACLPFCPGR